MIHFLYDKQVTFILHIRHLSYILLTVNIYCDIMKLSGGTKMQKILVVEDSKEIYEPLCEMLRSEGFIIELAVSQKEALNKIENADSRADLVLADLMLPDGHGFAVFSKANEFGIPVIFLTAVDDEQMTVTGIDMGAYDYIQKPYRKKELVSRIRACLRRNGKLQSVITCGEITIDTNKGTALKNGQDLYLSALEYRILLILMNNLGNIVTRDKLFDELWGITGEYIDDNTLSVYIKRLRKKLEDDPQNPKYIKTIRGFGYKIEK